jgi:hypothetical protein
LIEETWGSDTRPEVLAYLELVKILVKNIGRLKPSVQRELVLGPLVDEPTPVSVEEPEMAPPVDQPTEPQSGRLLDLARATAADGRQRAVGVQDPEELETVRDRALAEIGSLARDDAPVSSFPGSGMARAQAAVH